MTDDYVVVIPSYQRPERLFSHSLATLLEKGVRMDDVYVFLHDNDPFLDDYLAGLAALDVHPIVTGARGIGQQRQAIVDFFDEGTNIVCMDDDIEGVISTTGPRWANVFQAPDLHTIFREMFWEVRKRGLAVWGLAPVDNPFFLKPVSPEGDPTYSEGLKLVMFTMFGFINRPGHPVHLSTVRYKDEQEFSLRAWWYDGAVVRNESVAVKTVFYADGGCQAAGRTYQQVEESVVSLMAQWPDLIKRHTKRGSDWPEVRLARRARTEGHPLDSEPPGAELLKNLL